MGPERTFAPRRACWRHVRCPPPAINCRASWTASASTNLNSATNHAWRNWCLVETKRGDFSEPKTRWQGKKAGVLVKLLQCETAFGNIPIICVACVSSVQNCRRKEIKPAHLQLGQLKPKID